MRRIQWFEIHDQPWFPRLLRDDVTDALQLLLNLGKVYRPIAPGLQKAVEETRTHRILDLCAGAGGPWPWLSSSLAQDGRFPIDILLTDKYPHVGPSLPAQPAPGVRIHRLADPVDATQVPPELRGFRTLFTSFHHFPPREARGILRDAIDKHQGIAIFDASGRHLVTFLLIFLMPLGVLLLAPLMRPLRWSRLLWTYLLPVVPFVLFFDGIVSCLRVYSPPELRELLAGLPTDGYQCEIGVARGGFLRVPITYLIAYPGLSRPSNSSSKPEFVPS
jgi:hypothetical protein